MKITTCLWFNGQAREAANFYTSIFPDSSVSENWIAPTDTPGNAQGDEVVVNFKIFGQDFIGLNGVSWQVTSPEMGKYLGGSDPEGAQRATKAMLEMKKIDLAAMESAYLGK